MDIKSLYQIYLEHPDVTTDTRNIKKGQLFFALKGPSFNGNEFAMRALDAGASYAIVDEENDVNDPRIIKTDDVLKTLQQLAKYHRQQFSIPFLAITGSNGKTTTKELVHQVLSKSYRTHSTVGNLNNHIGIPLTILKIPLNAEMAAIEMGANHQKEIESYCQYTLPTHGLITNCGKAHLEGFGGVEGVIKGKGELFVFLKENNGVAFINNYDEAIKGLSTSIKEKYSFGPGGEVQGIAGTFHSFLSVKINTGDELEIQTNLVGDYNLPNVLAAVAIGRYFKVEDKLIKEAIENYAPSNSRSQLMELNGNKIILDAYNANPSSMKVAIENFARIEADKKILMLGSMMELGDESRKEHEAIIDLINSSHWENVVLVGDQFNEINHPYIKLKTSTEANAWFKEADLMDSSILIKGSRSMKMEKILE